MVTLELVDGCDGLLVFFESCMVIGHELVFVAVDIFKIVDGFVEVGQCSTKGRVTDPGLSGCATPVGADESDGNVQVLVEIASKEVSNCGELCGALGCACCP